MDYDTTTIKMNLTTLEMDIHTLEKRNRPSDVVGKKLYVGKWVRYSLKFRKVSLALLAIRSSKS